MNKREFAKLYRKLYEGDYTLPEALKDIEIFLATVEEGLKKDGKIAFVKRGTFEVLEKKPRMISNPATRELMKIYPKKTVRLRISKNIEK